ncbi:D-galactonate dehydratase family member RspA [archaeon HR06]|nr:D-galactonate dehydratase family member RspA [archaeon HR06]
MKDDFHYEVSYLTSLKRFNKKYNYSKLLKFLMKIKEIGTFVIRGNFDWVIVEIKTNDGLIGLGEAFPSQGVREMIKIIGYRILDEDPTEINRIFQKMYKYCQGMGYTYGVSMSAISGIEMALLDLYGKYYKIPLYKILGGKLRNKIRLYADCHAGEGEILQSYGDHLIKGSFDPEAFARKAEKVKREGYTALKFDIDLPGDYYSLTYEEFKLIEKLVDKVRETIGNNVDLALDCHWRYNLNDALKLAKILEPYNILWLEDPIPYENVKTMKELKNSVRIPICTGENLFTRYGFREIIENMAVDIISPDYQKAGGILEGKRIAELAEIYYIPVAPHNLCTPIGTVANAHLCSSLPNFLILEFHSEEVSWWEKLIKETIIEEGYLKIPDGPGLGIELNREELEKHLIT